MQEQIIETKEIIGIVKFGPKNIREFEGKKQIGFQLEGHEVWFNAYGSDEALKIAMGILTKGSKVSFKANNRNTIEDLKLIEKGAVQQSTGKFDDMNSFEDLLNAAHEQFKDGFEIQTQMMHVDWNLKNALFKATVSVGLGEHETSRQFEAHGDATEDNVTGEHIKPHFIRMAETRAIARALRWATNDARVAVEETNTIPAKEAKKKI